MKKSNEILVGVSANFGIGRYMTLLIALGISMLSVQFALAAVSNPSGDLLSRTNNPSAKVTASYSDSSRPASNINDGSDSTLWSNSNNEYNYYDRIVGDLSFPSTVNRIEILTNPGAMFDLEYFDSTDWQRVATFTMGNTYIKSFSVPNIKAQKWRLREFKSASSGKPVSLQINKWSIYGTVEAVDPAVNVDDGEHWETLAKAPVDECFYDVGSSLNIYPKGTEPCSKNHIEKRNESYVWGMTHYSDILTDRLYFGSGANVMCLAVQKYLLQKDPYLRRGDMTCEFDHNTLGYQDWRPPSLYIYNLKTKKLTQPVLPETADLLRQFTTGFRSAGNHKGIVFIGGPNLDNSINLFAFLGTTGQLIGATVLDFGYSNLRKMKVINGELYLGVGGAESADAVGQYGGAMLLWKGNSNEILLGNLKSLFDFEVVGTGIDAEATELSLFEGRIFASSWPDENSNVGGGLWRSPTLPLSSTATTTKQIWQTNTAGRNASNLLFQDDGNLVLYSTSGARLWSSNTANRGAEKAVLQDNGKFAIYGAENALLWCSDPNWVPKYPRINGVAIKDATVILPGSSIQLGSVVASHTGQYRLRLTTSGNLEVIANLLPWTRVWGADQYEPDAHVATTYGVSPTAEFEGWLYWGTMHVPSAALIKYEAAQGEQSTTNRAKLIHGWHREGSIFRGRNLGQSNQQIELLYGGYGLDEDVQPGYFPVKDGYVSQPEPTYSCYWYWWTYYCTPNYSWTNSGPSFTNKMNKMGQVPKYGKGGFGNTWNNYIWSLIVYNGDLYVGTMDHSEIVLEDTQYTRNYDISTLFKHNYGADLFKFDNANMSAVPVSVNGLGNPYAYGLRTMQTDGTSIFIGTGNNSNLNSKGGWELVEFSANEVKPKAGGFGVGGVVALLALLIRRRYLIEKRK